MENGRWLRKLWMAAVVGVVLTGCVWAQEAGKATAFKVYRVGGSVTAPKVIRRVEPEFSSEAREKKIEGAVLLSVLVNSKGIPEQVKVKRGLGYGLDENAVRSVGQWRFAPATKDGEPVATLIFIEVNFQRF